MLEKRIVVSFFFIIFFLLNFSSIIFARSGCCSYHGGVCGCGCCDGTSLSATCAPYYPNCGGGYESYYVAPKPTMVIPTIPSNAKGGPKYLINKNGVVDMLFDWDRPDGKQYSIAMSKTAGGDPGPNTDTTKSEYTFTNIRPGRWYVNVKEEFNGYWSEVAYWTIDIPNNVKDIARPYLTPTPIPTKQASPTTRDISDNDSSNSLQTIAMVGLGGGIYYFFNKIKKT